MRTAYPTNNLEEYFWYVLLGSGPDFEHRPQLYHYTKLENKPLILKNDCIHLRLTRADSFADTQEIQHIVMVMEDACTNCLHNGVIDEVFYDVINHAIASTEAILSEYRKYYIFCTSSNGDSAYLKEYYACRGNDEGLIIGFQQLAFQDYQWIVEKDREQLEDGIYLYDVIYNKAELQNAFSVVIETLYQMRDQDTRELPTIQKTIHTLVTMYSLAYKDPEFSDEEETRLIVDASKLPPKDEIKNTDDRYYYLDLPHWALYALYKVSRDDNRCSYIEM